MGKTIPDRWLDYRPIGERITGTRFIAFKVPLLENINKGVADKDLRLAPHSLLESVPNLGLIVDLTNTDRYYNPQMFTDLNVEHQKLKIPGHHTPPRELAQRFCEYVSKFLEGNTDNDKLIGVHCTHGVNRTGYLICYFMITKMNMAPKLAIQTFADARGHKIERENYTESLEQLVSSEKRPNGLNNSRLDNWIDCQRDWRQHPQQRPECRDLNWRAIRVDCLDSFRENPHTYTDYNTNYGRYQERINWEPKQTSHQREDEDRLYSKSYNGYNRSNTHSYNDYRRDNNFSRGTNYSRGHHFSRDHHFNRGNDNKYSRERSKIRPRSYHSYQYKSNSTERH